MQSVRIVPRQLRNQCLRVFSRHKSKKKESFTPEVTSYEHTLPAEFHQAFYATGEEDIAFLSKKGLRIVVMNRMKTLNALNTSVVDKLYKAFDALRESNQSYAMILTTINQKAFCAGGDVKSLYKAGKAEKFEAQRTFFTKEYNLNYRTFMANKYYMPYLNGLTLGGGCGLSMHSHIRIASENTIVGMPETSIGFFPDVGGCHFMSRMWHSLGMYMALTGARLHGTDLIHTRLATHFIDSTTFPDFTTNLALSAHSRSAVTKALEDAHKFPNGENLPPFSLDSHLSTIESCFSKNSVEEIVEALKAVDSDFARQTLAALERASPLSLKVTFRAMKMAETQPLSEVLKTDLVLAMNFMRHRDFYEGVDARLIRKDNKPRWTAATLSEVTDGHVDRMFDRHPDEKALVLDDELAPVTVADVEDLAEDEEEHVTNALRRDIVANIKELEGPQEEGEEQQMSEEETGEMEEQEEMDEVEEQEDVEMTDEIDEVNDESELADEETEVDDDEVDEVDEVDDELEESDVDDDIDEARIAAIIRDLGDRLDADEEEEPEVVEEDEETDRRRK